MPFNSFPFNIIANYSYHKHFVSINVVSFFLSMCHILESKVRNEVDGAVVLVEFTMSSSANNSTKTMKISCEQITANGTFKRHEHTTFNENILNNKQDIVNISSHTSI